MRFEHVVEIPDRLMQVQTEHEAHRVPSPF
jgi:hypothetical protein